jgi:nucleoid-associated protein YgaU
MPAGKKLVVAASVIATGVSAALFFRKDASQVTGWQEASAESPFRERVERRVAADAAWAKTTAGRHVESAARSAPAFRVPPAEAAAISAEPADIGQPTFQKSFNPVGALLAPIESVPIDEPEGDEPGWHDVADSPLTPSVPLVHRVRDGDTLSNLAERYLGRGDRYLEIFELNREVLTSPNLLPIGASLKIPPRNASSSGVTTRDWPADRAPADPPREMVPVERDNTTANEPA